MIHSSRPGALALALCVALAACTGDGPVAPPVEVPETPNLAALDCLADVAAATVGCRPASPSTGAASGLIVGGQGTYVQLTGSNVVFTPADSTFAFDATVQNLIPQPLGTTDGTAVDGGVRVFFAQPPAATTGGGAGTVAVRNAAGTMTYLSGDVPYFLYDTVLPTNAVSSAQPWKFTLDPGVTRFAFKVYVSANVPFPNGWVNVTPPADTLAAGDAQALAAAVVDVVGRPIEGQAVTWETSDASVATVSAAGVLTAVGPGAVTITATSGLRSGGTTIAVCPNLAVGEVYTAAMPAAGSVCLGGGASGAEYTYIPVNLASASSLALDVTAAGIIGVTGPPSPSRAPGGPSLLRAPALPMDDDLHARMMEADLRAIRGASPIRAARGGRGGGPSYLITKGPGVAVGDLMTLNTASGCAGSRVDQTGRVVSVGQNIVIVADTMNPSGGFTTAQYDSIAHEFDTQAHPVVTANFGAPTDLDGNGRVVAFYTRTVNLLTPPGSGSTVAGYVTARDLFSANPTGSCPRSNEGEMFYMLVPDPNAETGNTRTVASVRSGTVGTLAHEFQHLVNASRRIYLNGAWSGGLEAVWLNEGLSHVAEELMFYNAAGLAPRGNIALGTITASQARLNAYNRYSSQNIGRLRIYLQRPDTAGPYKANDVLATRGAVWAFLRYAADRRNGDDQALWQSLVNTQTSGTANLQAAFGTDPLPWVRDFTAAMYADDAVTGVSAPYQVTSWNFRSVYSGISTGVYPLLPRPLANGVADARSYSAGGGSAHYRFGVAAGAFAGVRARSGGALPTSPYALAVVRTK